MNDSRPPRVLVVDDDARLLEALVKALQSMGYEARGEVDPVQGLERIQSWRPEVAVVDLKMPLLDGVTFAERARAVEPDLEVIVLTGFGTIRNAVDAVRRGVYDYLTKPFDLDEVDVTLRRALDHRRLRGDNRSLAETLGRLRELEGMVGESPAMERVFEAVAAVADTDSTVLITGESGTGKELVAKAIHASGRRRDKPFVTVDCAAIPSTLLESELFGHVRGAFTGAQRDRRGFFEVAADGTVFLDEAGELDPPLQKKLLRLLEEKTFVRVGDSLRRTTEARVVAATNRDLAAEVDSGRFREDLYYRLKVIEIHVPPLRDRPEDVPVLADLYRERLNRKLNREVRSFTPEATALLQAYSWPGNVRELVNVLEQVMTFHRPASLGVEHLPGFLREIDPGDPARPPELTYPDLKERVVEEAGRSYLESLLRHYRGNVTRVAEHAGLDRRHIHRLLRKFEIDPVLYR